MENKKIKESKINQIKEEEKEELIKAKKIENKEMREKVINDIKKKTIDLINSITNKNTYMPKLDTISELEKKYIKYKIKYYNLKNKLINRL